CLSLRHTQSFCGVVCVSLSLSLSLSLCVCVCVCVWATLGVCPQTPDGLFPTLTGREHLRLYGRFKGMPRCTHTHTHTHTHTRSLYLSLSPWCGLVWVCLCSRCTRNSECVLRPPVACSPEIQGHAEVTQTHTHTHSL